ncbi:acetyl-CoA synthetase-like protein [Amylocystis lapponica]|nr:acetyl-CoA synthetase-like protein [Amylocystis lapponica]
MSFKTHLTVLRETSALHAASAVFWVPDISTPKNEAREWTKITYKQFECDVEGSAKYWTHMLNEHDVPASSVVALWLGGMSYMDVLHIYGIARAGYIPQLCSLRLPNADVIYELMSRAGAQALIYNPLYESQVSSCPVPKMVAADISFVDVADVPLPDISNTTGDKDDIVMIFHTSGSTSGSPKLVRCTRRWLDATVSKAHHLGGSLRPGRQDVSVWMGSMCHIGQTCMLIAALQQGACVVQPTCIAFTSDELLDMIRCCGVNRLMQFASFLSTHLRNSRDNSKLLGVLQGLDEVLYSGLALPREDEEWAYRNGILLRNLFGNTECGAMLLSIGGRGQDAALLRPIGGTSYGFLPIAASPDAAMHPHQNVNSQLRELVILSSSGDCPDRSLLQSDGHYHTGDLFIENALRCDTKAIEDNVRATCADLVGECVVQKGPIDTERLKKEIIRRTRHFHSRRYLHERITSPDFIIVVQPHTLPRTATKGNVRRKAVEDTYKVELDCMYAAAARSLAPSV